MDNMKLKEQWIYSSKIFQTHAHACINKEFISLQDKSFSKIEKLVRLDRMVEIITNLPYLHLHRHLLEKVGRLWLLLGNGIGTPYGYWSRCHCQYDDQFLSEKNHIKCVTITSDEMNLIDTDIYDFFSNLSNFIDSLQNEHFVWVTQILP